VSNVLAIPKISAVGSKFFTSDGEQFYIKGMRDTHPSRLLRSLLSRHFAQVLLINLLTKTLSSTQTSASWMLPL
jgi:hypothetical protein